MNPQGFEVCNVDFNNASKLNPIITSTMQSYHEINIQSLGGKLELF